MNHLGRTGGEIWGGENKGLEGRTRTGKQETRVFSGKRLGGTTWGGGFFISQPFIPRDQKEAAKSREWQSLGEGPGIPSILKPTPPQGSVNVLCPAAVVWITLEVGGRSSAFVSSAFCVQVLGLVHGNEQPLASFPLGGTRLRPESSLEPAEPARPPIQLTTP